MQFNAYETLMKSSIKTNLSVRKLMLVKPNYAGEN
jgi:hypothetical protein